MNKRPTMLSATFVKSVNVPGRYGDGRGGLGLTLLVKPSPRRGCRKSWGQSIRINGRKTTLGLGTYPVITLAMARARALENARAIAQGRDPRRASNGVPTFAKAADTVIAIHSENWKPGSRSEESWRASLRDYAMPRLGDRRAVAGRGLPPLPARTGTGQLRGRRAGGLRHAAAERRPADVVRQLQPLALRPRLPRRRQHRACRCAAARPVGRPSGASRRAFPKGKNPAGAQRLILAAADRVVPSRYAHPCVLQLAVVVALGVAEVRRLHLETCNLRTVVRQSVVHRLITCSAPALVTNQTPSPVPTAQPETKSTQCATLCRRKHRRFRLSSSTTGAEKGGRYRLRWEAELRATRASERRRRSC